MIAAYLDESGYAGDLGTEEQWGVFGLWADGHLDADTYPAVLHLWEHGFEDDLPALAEQVRAGLAESPPDDSMVPEVAQSLLDAIEGRAEADSAVAVALSPGEPAAESRRGDQQESRVEITDDLSKEAVREERRPLPFLPRKLVSG